MHQVGDLKPLQETGIRVTLGRGLGAALIEFPYKAAHFAPFVVGGFRQGAREWQVVAKRGTQSEGLGDAKPSHGPILMLSSQRSGSPD